MPKSKLFQKNIFSQFLNNNCPQISNRDAILAGPETYFIFYLLAPFARRRRRRRFNETRTHIQLCWSHTTTRARSPPCPDRCTTTIADEEKKPSLYTLLGRALPKQSFHSHTIWIILAVPKGAQSGWFVYKRNGRGQLIPAVCDSIQSGPLFGHLTKTKIVSLFQTSSPRALQKY